MTADPPGLLKVARWMRDARGLSVIPLDHPDAPVGGDPEATGKLPIASWKCFQQARATDDNLAAWFGNGTPRNLAIVTGRLSGVVVVDSDSPEADAWAADYLPPTPMMTKTAKGCHRFYRHPGGVVRNKVRVGGNGLALDVRGDGGYVVAPPSLHHTRVSYERIGPWPLVAELPVFDRSWLIQESPRDGRPASSAGEPPTQARLPVATDVEAARAYVAKIPGAIEGEGGDALTYRVACELMRDFGLSLGDARVIFREWNQSCRPPWTDADLDAKLAHAMNYGWHAIGTKSDAVPYRPDADVSVECGPWYEEGPKFARHADFPLPPMLVEGLLPGDGLALLHADPRCLKTWIAADVALAVATGTPALTALPVPAAAAVLYVSNEDSRQRTAERLRKLARGRGLDDLPPALLLAVQSGVWLDDEEWQESFRAVIAERGVRLVIFDPLRSLTGAVDQGPRDLQPFATFLRQLIRETGCAVLAVHHDVKPLAHQTDTRKRAYRASGGGIFAIADAPIHVERMGDDPVVTVYPSAWKFSETPSPLEVRLTVTDCEARLLARPTTAASAQDRDLRDRVRRYLAEHPGESGNAIAKGTRAKREAVSRVLDALAAAGEVDSHQGAKRARLWCVRGECFHSADAPARGNGEC